MRTIAITSLIAVAAAIRIQKSALDEICEQVMEDWDWNQDGDLSEDEFLGLVTYLDEDQYLTPEETEWALQQYQIADPESAIWLTDTISASAGGEDSMANIDYDDFMNLGTKLGGEEWEVDEMWWEADQDGSGDLDIWEQDQVWYSLMEEDTKTPMEEIVDQVMKDWDWNQDGELDEKEFLELCTYLDEDQYLTPEETEWALQQYQYADPTDAIWLTDTFSSAAGGEAHMDWIGYDDFMNFGTKLGGEWWELDEMWWEADQDGDGLLNLYEQDSVWWSLMEENDDYDKDTVDHLWDIEESAWDILDTVWEAQDDMWEDEWGCDCWDDEWGCDCWNEW